MNNLLGNTDWRGRGRASVFKTLGASNHTDNERAEHDYYATDPKAAEMLLDLEDFDPSVPIWEPAAGECHLADVFTHRGYEVRKTDIVQRRPDVGIKDFLEGPLFHEGVEDKWHGHIVTNPPYAFATEFVRHALDLVDDGRMVCMFLKLTFLEGLTRRRELFDVTPPARVWVSSGRLVCAKNGDFEAMRHCGSAAAYAWYVWAKGFKGDPVIKWFN